MRQFEYKLIYKDESNRTYAKLFTNINQAKAYAKKLEQPVSIKQGKTIHVFPG